jgi:hypothetical protein
MNIARPTLTLKKAKIGGAARGAVVPISDGPCCKVARELRAKRKVARDAFCSTLGWTHGESFTSAQLRLAEGWRHPLDDCGLSAHQNGCIDLPEYYWEGRVPVGIVSLTTFPIDQVQAFAEIENMRVEPMPAYWVTPPGRIAVVFMRPGYLSKNERLPAGGKAL